jgi:hypothetical protein
MYHKLWEEKRGNGSPREEHSGVFFYEDVIESWSILSFCGPHFFVGIFAGFFNTIGGG